MPSTSADMTRNARQAGQGPQTTVHWHHRWRGRSAVGADGDSTRAKLWAGHWEGAARGSRTPGRGRRLPLPAWRGLQFEPGRWANLKPRDHVIELSSKVPRNAPASGSTNTPPKIEEAQGVGEGGATQGRDRRACKGPGRWEFLETRHVPPLGDRGSSGPAQEAGWTYKLGWDPTWASLLALCPADAGAGRGSVTGSHRCIVGHMQPPWSPLADCQPSSPPDGQPWARDTASGSLEGQNCHYLRTAAAGERRGFCKTVT